MKCKKKHKEKHSRGYKWRFPKKSLLNRFINI